jgi:predicted DNA-binding antitoxin AbrB/MazE fold protein
MAQIIEAIYTKGVLRPKTALNLKESQRVRLTIEPVFPLTASERVAVLDRIRKGIQEMGFCSDGPPLTRQQIHDRD